MTGEEADRKRAASALRGVRVAVTRPPEGTDSLEAALEAEGAVVVRLPMAHVEPETETADLRRLLDAAAGYDWVAFTSATAVRLFVELGGRPAARVAVVGPATAAVAAAAGMTVSAVPEQFVAEAVVPAMESVARLAGARVLWPRSAGARPALAAALRDAGASVDEVVLYRTVEDAEAGRRLHEAVQRGAVDVLTFTSPSAVRGYCRGGGGAAAGVIVTVIGPVTAAAAREAGLPVDVEPAEHTVTAMVASLRAFYERRGQSKHGQGGVP